MKSQSHERKISIFCNTSIVTITEDPKHRDKVSVSLLPRSVTSRLI